MAAVKGFLSNCDSDVCGNSVIQLGSSRIIGGQKTVSGTLPWMALLASCGNFACGGVILNKQFILTAAHCFLENGDGCDIKSRGNWDVYLGKQNVQKYDFGEMKFQVESIFTHPLYDNVNHINDIALLKLTQNITYNSLISPVCLPTIVQTPHAGQSCIVAGYGDTLTFDRYVLHHVAVPIVSDDQCQQPDWYGTRAIFFPPTQFCAGLQEGGKDACYGDSGSPLICKFDGKWFASGIVSSGQRCGLPKQPGIYSNVTHNEFWIRTTLATHSNLLPCDIF